MDYKQRKGNLRGQIKNQVERKLYNKRKRAEAIAVDTSERQLTIPDVSNSVFCPNCKTNDMITVDNWCMRCGTVLKKIDC